MSSSGNKETEEHSEVQSKLEDGGLHRGGVVGDLSTYRDHVVRLTEGMPGFEGFIPFFDEEEGMEAPTYLFLVQDPHKSGVEKSGVVSHTNNDASARMIPPQLEAPRDERESPETVEEAPERVETPVPCSRSSGGRTEALVA
jgi:hypothetical protein